MAVHWRAPALLADRGLINYLCNECPVRVKPPLTGRMNPIPFHSHHEQ